MGVLACSRKDCSKVMCDTYIPGVGYVCNECEREFKEYISTLDNPPTNERDIVGVLSLFMATDKGKFTKGADVTVDEFFNSHRR